MGKVILREVQNTEGCVASDQTREELGFFEAEHVVGEVEVKDVQEAGCFHSTPHMTRPLIRYFVLHAAELACNNTIL